MNLSFFIKNAPDIIENQVKNALIKVAKENSIPDATQMNVLVHYKNKGDYEQILFIPHYKDKEVARIPLSKLINGEIGRALKILMLKIWNNEKTRHGINIVFVNFIMKLQPNGVVLVWPFHHGNYGDQMNIQQFLSL